MTRSKFTRIFAMCLMCLAVLMVGCGSSNSTKAATPAPAQSTSNKGGEQIVGSLKDKKVLVVYFSWSGNTKAVAEAIHKQVGGDLQAIVPETPYSETYAITVAKAKQEQLTNARPQVKTKIQDIASYDLIFLGYPNWWGSLPMPVVTFLGNHKLQGKIVAPFFTHGGGGVQRCYSDLEKYAAGANLKNYLCLSGNAANSSAGEIENWVKEVAK